MQFCAEWFGCAERAGHDAEEVAIGERDDGAEELFRFAGGEGDHGVTHEGDADFVGEAAGYFFAVDEAHWKLSVLRLGGGCRTDAPRKVQCSQMRCCART